jgi:hypothetical protein
VIKKTRRLTQAGFGLPKKLSDESFDHICKAYKLSGCDRVIVQQRLDEFVHECGKWMIERGGRDFQADREGIKKAIAQLDKTIDGVLRLGDSGTRALKYIAPKVGPLLSAEWFASRFNNYDWRSVGHSGRAPTRVNPRAEKFLIEEDTRVKRIAVLRERPKELIDALKVVQAGLQEAEAEFAFQSGAKGGPKPLEDRYWFIVNMSRLWNDIGLPVMGGPGSSFTGFCEAVADGFGWPMDGMVRAVDKMVSKHCLDGVFALTPRKKSRG